MEEEKELFEEKEELRNTSPQVEEKMEQRLEEKEEIKEESPISNNEVEQRIEVKEEAQEAPSMAEEKVDDTKVVSEYKIEESQDQTRLPGTEGSRRTNEGFFTFSNDNKDAVHRMEFGNAAERRAGAETWTRNFRELARSGDPENRAFDIRLDAVDLNKE